jgi:hypothetical protein
MEADDPFQPPVAGTIKGQSSKVKKLTTRERARRLENYTSARRVYFPTIRNINADLAALP